MKLMLLTLVALFFLAAPALAAETTVVTLCENRAIAASGGYTSAVLDVGAVEGYFSLQVHVRGEGTCKIQYQTSNDLTAWAEPQGVTAVLSGLTKTSGPGSNGKLIDQITVEFGRYLRFCVTETGESAAVLVTLRVAYR